MAGVSRSTLEQRAAMAAGKCTQCREPRDCESKRYCLRCLERKRERQRKAPGFRSWEQSGKGRRPIRGITVAQAREWFQKFGHLPDVISPNGRRFFLFLLEKVERL